MIRLRYYTGVLNTYQDNGVFDYEKLASFNAKRAATLYSAHATPPVDFMVLRTRSSVGATRRFYGVDGDVPFNNDGQVDAMEQSPFEVTIFMDADFLPVTSGLLAAASMCGPDRPLMFLTSDNIMRSNLRDHLRDDAQNPFEVWSTVLVYYNDRSPFSVTRRFFDQVRNVRDNWSFYASRLGVTDQFFRNDFAFAIAAQRILPPHLATLPEFYRCVFYMDEECTGVTSDSVYVRGMVSPYDAHVMHKPSLLRTIHG